MEVKSSEGTVVVADRNNCCNDNVMVIMDGALVGVLSVEL